ncbi:MAG: aminotransferase class V-fold PLP-dependent enzyme, partial [Acidobacteriota bacterium]|nr:aminotransferase class V-fold PLP-dependent enzyme [Acidobacteriota bacterium]
MSFNVAKVRQDFPIFERTIRDGKKLVYLDSGATSQKPLSVIDAESDFYKFHNAAVHRGAHQLAEEATDAFEGARLKVSNFIGAQEDQIVFTKSATESLNLVAYAMGNAQPGSRFALTSKDRIVVSEMEHHANLIPWQQLAARTGAQLSWFEITPEGRLDLSNINA